MSKTSLKLNRWQLDKITGGDKQAIIAFEELFRRALSSSTNTPSDDALLNSGLAGSQANVAANVLEEFKDQIVQDVLTALSSLIQPTESYTPPTPESDGNFQSLTNGDTVLLKTSKSLVGGGASGAATLTNAPQAGNPTKWVSINDNGTIRYIPTW